MEIVLLVDILVATNIVSILILAVPMACRFRRKHN